jgi:hypothetical protein
MVNGHLANVSFAFWATHHKFLLEDLYGSRDSAPQCRNIILSLISQIISQLSEFCDIHAIRHFTSDDNDNDNNNNNDGQRRQRRQSINSNIK